MQYWFYYTISKCLFYIFLLIDSRMTRAIEEALENFRVALS